MKCELVNKELMHYGVVGMKWGVRRAKYKSSSNERLRRKALSYDKKSAELNKKSEKAHAKIDLAGSNKAAAKAATYSKKAAATKKKAIGETNEVAKSMLNRKAARLEYKSAVKRMDANRISKTSGYGAQAMKYSMKSDIVAMKAAKARQKIASNEAYISKMKQKISEIPEADIRRGYELIAKEAFK